MNFGHSLAFLILTLQPGANCMRATTDIHMLLINFQKSIKLFSLVTDFLSHENYNVAVPEKI